MRSILRRHENVSFTEFIAFYFDKPRKRLLTGPNSKPLLNASEPNSDTKFAILTASERAFDTARILSVTRY